MELTDENIFDVTKYGNFLILAYTDWCPRCLPEAEKLETLEKDSMNFKYAKFHFQDCPKATKKFDIITVPTVICMKDGIVQDIKAGSEIDYYEMLENF